MPEAAEWEEGSSENLVPPPRKRDPDHKVVIQFEDHKSPAGPKARRKVEWIHISEDDEYADHKVLARIRYPDVINQEFSSGDFGRVRAALRKVILEHNGWVDPDTELPMPPASEDEFWNAVSQEEILMMMRALGNERKKLLSSLLPTPDA